MGSLGGLEGLFWGKFGLCNDLESSSGDMFERGGALLRFRRRVLVFWPLLLRLPDGFEGPCP